MTTEVNDAGRVVQDCWSDCRATLIKLILDANLVPADEYGVRRPDTAPLRNIGILCERTRTWFQRFRGMPSADWIGTAYFPHEPGNCIFIEVFGKGNMAVARQIAWKLKLATGHDAEARHACNRRTEQEDLLRTANVDGWGESF